MRVESSLTTVMAAPNVEPTPDAAKHRTLESETHPDLLAADAPILVAEQDVKSTIGACNYALPSRTLVWEWRWMCHASNPTW